MLTFLVKKWFFDVWDHLLTVVLLGFGSVGLALLALLFLRAARGGIFVFLLVGVLWLLLFFAWTGVQAYLLKPIADFKSPNRKEVRNAVRMGWLPGIQMGGTVILLVLICAVIIPFYLRMGNRFGIFAASLLCWCAFLLALIVPFFMPVQISFGTSYFQTIKQCFLICFDNFGFSLFLGMWSLLLVIASCATAFMLPGLAGLQLAALDALRLRLYRYDWLRAHPEAGRDPIPWKSLLGPDRELVGERSLRSMVFPWKD